ncbi:MAG: hypothetical protein HC880_06650 [Bacteroidia bacterium]|nr:hypothetical protein [Bacteroidia bacterium]
MSTRTECTPCPLCGSGEYEFLIRTQVQMQNAPGSFTFVRCRHCDMIYLNPRVYADDVGQFYPENYFPYLGEQAWGRFARLVYLSYRAMDRRRVKVARRAYPVQSESRVLDLGCGRPTFYGSFTSKQTARHSVWILAAGGGREMLNFPL